MKEIICIVCPKGCRLLVDEENGFNVSGFGCNRGIEYGKTEVQNPTRIITSTVSVNGSRITRCPIKTSNTIPKGLLLEAMTIIKDTKIKAPVKEGEVVINNICSTGVDCVATRDCDV